MSTHFEEWLEVLSTTDLPQVTGKLAGEHRDVYGLPTGRTGYCCLGIACTLAPDGKQWLDSGATMLPYPVAEWMGVLGYSSRIYPPEPNDTFDIMLDAVIESRPYATGTIEMQEFTAAGMNDSGFTFSQIADMFRYFGIKRLT